MLPESEEKMQFANHITKSSSLDANADWEYVQYVLKIINKIARKEQRQNLFANSNKSIILTFFIKWGKHNSTNNFLQKINRNILSIIKHKRIISTNKKDFKHNNLNLY